MRDPRDSARYQRTRRLWIAAYQGGLATCCMCGRAIDTSLPGTHPWGPTIEHRLPIRVMQQMALDWPDLIALACDTSRWALAHNRCNGAQGGSTTKERKPRTMLTTMQNASREW